MLKNPRQAQRYYSLKSRPETIRCPWIPLLKLRAGTENQSKKKSASDVTTRLFLRPRSSETELTSPSNCCGLVQFSRRAFAVAQKGQRQMDNAGRHIGFRRIVD